MKTILLLIHDDEGQEARLQAALDVTRAVEGHLKCLDVSVPPLLPVGFYPGMGDALLLADEHAREAENKSRLEARLTAERLPWDWVDTTGDIGPALVDASALADLIVVDRRLDGVPLAGLRDTVGEVVVRSGKPILAVPHDTRGFNLCGRSLLCWDGSACAAAALRAAVPLLRLADNVTLLEIEEKGRESSVEDAAQYLSRHDIDPLVRRRRLITRGVAETMLDEIHNERADYVVMGGFGHLRFAEALFGGVTRAMFKACPIPIFMAH